jgi:hypothetical protein
MSPLVLTGVDSDAFTRYNDTGDGGVRKRLLREGEEWGSTQRRGDAEGRI